jgi:hypothetical protein
MLQSNSLLSPAILSIREIMGAFGSGVGLAGLTANPTFCWNSRIVVNPRERVQRETCSNAE